MPISSVPERITWAVEQLAVRRADRLLEVGCGPGQAVALLCAQPRCGTITAIDRSALQVARACARNQACIAAGRLRIEKLPLAEAPDALGDCAFTKVFSVNVNAFWTEPAPSIASLSRLLRPSGLVYLIYEPPSVARLREMQTSLPRFLQMYGLRVEDVRTVAFRASRGLCIIARRRDNV